MRQVQIIVLEKSDQQLLKSGQVITLTMPTGETVQISFDGKHNVRKPEIEESKNSDEGVSVAEKTRKFMENNKGWFKVRDVATSLSSNPMTVGIALRHSIYKRRAGGKTNFGTKIYEYKGAK